MNGLTPESRKVMLECLHRFGALNCLEAYLEWEFVYRFGELPDDARFVQVDEVEVDVNGDASLVFGFRSANDVRAH